MVVANQLFDALTAANVPRDQAHAVVDALEHRMTSELATKADLERGIAGVKADIAATKADLEREIAGLRAATKADLEREIAGVKSDIASLRAATKADLEREIAGVKADIAALRAATKADLEREISGVRIDIAKLDTKMETLHRKLTIQFGSMMIATAGMLFAALTYTNQ